MTQTITEKQIKVDFKKFVSFYTNLQITKLASIFKYFWIQKVVIKFWK